MGKCGIYSIVCVCVCLVHGLCVLCGKGVTHVWCVCVCQHRLSPEINVHTQFTHKLTIYRKPAQTHVGDDDNQKDTYCGSHVRARDTVI